MPHARALSTVQYGKSSGSDLGCVVASFDKALYDAYPCLAASNKQQIYLKIRQTLIEKIGILSTQHLNEN